MTPATNTAKEPAALILGAGFSTAAGLPLTRDLFRTAEIPRYLSKASQKNHQEVLRAWSRWKSFNQSANAEEWLRVLYGSDPPNLYGTTFHRAVRFALARLVDVPGGRMSAYYYGITTPLNSSNHRRIQSELHLRFWQQVRTTFELSAIVSMNYDILVEQALKADAADHRSAPLCHYGGQPVSFQRVKTYTNVPKQEFKETTLGTGIALYKMHGSLNWSLDPHGFEIRDHVGAVFRADDKKGEVAIVPPLPEKDQPPWLSLTWRYAERALVTRPIWIICGYSLPHYDKALRNFFSRAASNHTGLRIAILDPKASEYLARWEKIAPKAQELLPLPGLPEVLESHQWEKVAAL